MQCFVVPADGEVDQTYRTPPHCATYGPGASAGEYIGILYTPKSVYLKFCVFFVSLQWL